MTEEEQKEPFISQEDIENLKARDVRWSQIDLAIKVDQELQDSPTVNLILDAITRHSTDAMEGLINADPLDSRRISSLQASILYGRFIANKLNLIRQEGLMAQATLEEEGRIELEGKRNG